MKPRTPMVRDIESGVAAALRDSDIRHAGRQVGTLIAEHAPDEEVLVPVGTLTAYREHVRRELLGELDEAGRLLPEPEPQLSPVTDAALALLRATGIGRAFGVVRAWETRDGRLTRLELGGGPS